MNSKITTAVTVVVGAVVIVALTLWVASFTIFAGAAVMGQSTTTLTLLQAEPEIEVVNSINDGILTFFEGDLTTTSGAEAGVLAGSILTVDVADLERGEIEARSRTLTFDTPDGQIQVAGLSYYPIADRELAKAEPVVIAVVGGTGKYLGATGEVETTRLADGSYEHVFTFVAR